ncbi:hypothetical protein NQ317_015149 [Molorchus minor]|uniref:Bromodomain associated domain-containing protein n=1 Tax=Molorchus minor TaxID=1323400 RepID=A0ABQ9K4X4_9CUCU|nr:hypothetical protein NQ317_015149 [Molorchus minor]
MPVMPEIDVKHKTNSLNFMPTNSTTFSSEQTVNIPELSEPVLRNIVTKCVAIMFAHVGFETTHQSVLDVMTDVLENFFQIICQRIVECVEAEERGNGGDFPNVVEKVLTEMGMGGVKGLDDYYQNRVVKYINVLQKRCKELNDRYAVLLIPKAPSPVDSKLIRVKVEEDQNFDGNRQCRSTFGDFRRRTFSFRHGIPVIKYSGSRRKIKFVDLILSRTDI